MKRYSHKNTSEIKELLRRIGRVQILVEELPVSAVVEENLRRQSLLKSFLFSARIEGNRLRLRDLRMLPNADLHAPSPDYAEASVGRQEGIASPSLLKSLPAQAGGLGGVLQDNRERLEVANVLAALRWIRSKRGPRRISLKVIRELHALVLKHLSGDAGKFRTQPSAIFNQAGMAVRLNPSPQQVRAWLSEWLVWVKELMKKEPVPVAAALAHVGFEKIHPFEDGNGRVGRLVSQFILDRGGFNFKGLVSIEEYLSKNRQEYYDLLAEDKSDATGFVEFYLTAMAESGEQVVRKFKRCRQSMLQSIEESLLPRRKEILRIIREHQQMSFDALRRRFLEVNQHTLRYDLRQLVKSRMVRKLGSTRGALYEV